MIHPTKPAHLRRHGFGVLLALTLCLVMGALVACGGKDDEPTQAAMNPGGQAAATLTPLPTDAPTLVPTATPRPTDTPAPTPEPTSDPAINPLTGLRVSDPAILNLRPVAMRIGNDPSVRPQEGMSFADVVYEEIMEGWVVTRFTAIFYGEEAGRVRPLRSARLSSLSIAPQYDAALVHTGASDQIRWYISQATFVDLDQYYVPSPYHVMAGYDWRGRMYTSTEEVHDYLQAQGLERGEPINGYTFDEAVPAGSPATSVRIPYPASAAVDWKYDAESGEYRRYVVGMPHLDGLSGEQLTADNVIILYAEHRRTDIVEDSLGSTAIDIVLHGEGRAQVIRDGVVVEGTWRQRLDGELIQYYDSKGEIIPFRPGQTWIQLVPTDYQVTVQ